MAPIHQIISALTHGCTKMLAWQMSRGWPWSLRRAQRAAGAEVGEGLLGAMTGWVPRQLPAEKPLAVWRPGNVAPSFGMLSYRARRRWTQDNSRAVAYYATARAAALFGGCAGDSSDWYKALHELQMTEIYLRFRERRPGIEQFWYRGDVARRFGLSPGDRIPDAYLFCPCGRVEWVIEAITTYSSARIRSFHQWAQEHDYAYQLW